MWWLFWLSAGHACEKGASVEESPPSDGPVNSDCGMFSWLLINVPEPNPLWVVPSVNRWSWAVQGPYGSQKQSVPCGLCCSCLPKPLLPTLVSGSD